jgi:anti-sigma B factor antagonist
MSPHRPALQIDEPAAAGGGPRVLALSGRLAIEGAPLLQEHLRKLLAAGVQRVVLDFGGVAFVSSMGIGMLIACIGEYRDVGGGIALVNLRPEVESVLEMIGLLAYLQD